MKQKTKANLAGFASIVIAMVLVMGSWGLGLHFADQSAVWKAALGVSLLLLFIMGLTNVLRLFLWKRSADKLTARQIFDKGIEYKRRTDADPEGQERLLKRRLLAAGLWGFVAAALILFVCFSFGKLTVVNNGGADGEAADGLAGGIVICILAAFFLDGFVYMLLRPEAAAELPPAGVEMNRADYPRLFGLLDEAARLAGCKKRVRVFFSGNGFSVGERNREICVYVGAAEFALLTGEEAYSVLLHEFAHVKNEDTSKTRKYARACERLALPDGFFFSVALGMANILFLSYYAERTEFAFTLLRELDSRRKEIAADAFVKEKGLRQPYINATAKGELFLLYNEGPAGRFRFESYASEEPSEELCERMLEDFKRALGENEELWNYILRHEIPARIDSHPTFRMRMEQMELSDYDYTTVETDAEYAAEQKKAVRQAGLLMRKGMEADYREIHGQYLEMKEKMQACGEEEEAGLSVPELAERAELFFGADNARALRIAEKMEEKQPGSAAAAFYRGMILAGRGDEACIPLLYRAAEEPDFSETAMETAGRFACRMGRQDLLDDYRARAPEVMQKLMDGAKLARVTARADFEPLDIPEEYFSPFLEGLIREGKGEIVRVYAAKKKGGEGERRLYVYAIELKEGFGRSAERNKELYEIRQALYRYLQNGDLPEEYRFFSAFCASDKQMKKFVAGMKKGAPDCKVYDAEETR